MPLVCRNCHRANPADAVYCYHDGVALDTSIGGSGPIAMGAMRFRSPFVFPGNIECKTLDELVLACESNWMEARSLLTRGYFENFFGGLGRADLARSAHQASIAPDPDRGLDEFLAKLPARTRQQPQLVVRPTEINLGRMTRDRDHPLHINLINQGMGLIHGNIRCVDCDWLSVGDGSGINRKMFQFRGEMQIPLRIIGRCLRAGNKPQEAQLTIESNAGSFVVLVHLEVPARPFPAGVLGGALTPREIASKAKASVREAAPLFENGAVAAWYESNGWIYPVAGPPASGMGGVQQFFEALGLTQPPRVEILTPAISFQGPVGAELCDEIRLHTVEKRPVFASCVTPATWLKVGKPLLEKQMARIPLTIGKVPSFPGQRLQTQAIVTANGNQRFVIDVSLQIRGSADHRTPVPEVAVLPAYQPAAIAVPISSYPDSSPGHWSQTPPLARIVPEKEDPSHPPGPRLTKTSGLSRKDQEYSRTEEVLSGEDDGDLPAKSPFWPHLMPAFLLALCLLGTLTRDLVVGAMRSHGPAASEGPLDPQPRIALHFHDQDSRAVVSSGGGVKRDGDPNQRQTPVTWEASMRFGLTMLDTGQRNSDHKRLTYNQDGTTNSTVLKIDGQESTFGDAPWRRLDGSYMGELTGNWKEKNRHLPDTANSVQGRESIWQVRDSRIEISQRVMIIRGDQTRMLDTCFVRYQITNRDHIAHRCGLRFLLDTFIGSNDGVPFLIPGASAMCSTSLDFKSSRKIPQFIQACERENLSDPGTIAQVGLKLNGLEPPSRVTLGAYPDPNLRQYDPLCAQEKTMWEVPVLKIHTLEPGDSCVVIYWDEQNLKPGETRQMGFTYGLGSVASTEGAGKLALTVGGSFTPRGEFTVTAYVRNPVPNQKVTLKLPAGFDAIDPLQQAVPGLPPGSSSSNSPVTWKVRGPSSSGTYELRVDSSTGVYQTHPVRIQSRGIFGE